jgi:hypothetical protein
MTDQRQEICVCTHSRSIHAGRDKSGDCLRVIDNAGRFCRCGEFRLAKAKRAQVKQRRAPRFLRDRKA